MNNEPFDTLYPPPVFTFRLFRLGDNYSDTGGGLYPEQVQQWRQACILGQQSARTLQQAQKAQAKADKKRIRQLEQELRRKDKALAEAAALLILQKKLDAYWSNVDEDN